MRVLEYSVRRPPYRAILVALVLLISVSVASFSWMGEALPRAVSALRDRSTLRRCMTRAIPADKMVYSDDPLRLAAIAGSPAYSLRRYPWDHVVAVDQDWRTLTKSETDLLFAGPLRSRGGDKLVFIHFWGRQDEGEDGVKLVEICTAVLDPTLECVKADRATTNLKLLCYATQRVEIRLRAVPGKPESVELVVAVDGLRHSLTAVLRGVELDWSYDGHAIPWVAGEQILSFPNK